MKPRIRAVLFDMDGVLLESTDAWFRLANAAARDLGHPPISREAFREAWGQGIEEDVRVWFPGRSPDRIEAYYVEHFARHAAGGAVRVDPDAAAVLEALRRAGLGTAVITNTPQAIAAEALRAGRLAPDVVVGTGSGVPSKPAPDMVLRACAALGVEPAEAIVVGDSRFDREAARAAGAPFMGFRTHGEAGRVESLREVPRRAAPDGPLQDSAGIR